MTLININEISSIKAFLNRYCNYYEYKERKTFLGFETRKSGFYYLISLTDYLVSENSILKEGYYIIKGKSVYWKPYLIITLKNGKTHEKRFDSENDLNNWIDLYIDRNKYLSL